MNSKRPIKSCVCSVGFSFDQIGSIKTTKYMLSLQWVIVLNVLPAAESWVRNRSLLGSRSRALGCFSKLHSIYAIFCSTFLWHHWCKLSRNWVECMPLLEQVLWAQCIEYNVLYACFVWSGKERENRFLLNRRSSTEGTHCSHLCWHRSVGLLIAPDREALFLSDQTTNFFCRNRQLTFFYQTWQ